MRRGTWLVTCLVLMPLAIAVGVAIGIMLPRVSQIGPRPTTTSTGPLSGVRIEELELGEKLFKVVGQEAVAFKYSGGDVEFWIELETDGNKQKFGMMARELAMISSDAAPKPDEVVEGYFVWIRQKDYEEDRTWRGKEWWRVGFSRELVSSVSSGVRISSPIVQGEVTKSENQRESSSSSSSDLVQVWKGIGRGSYEAVQTSIPTPLPADKEVCIRTITEGSKEGEETIDHHVIRIMCKVPPREEQTEETNEPAG